MKKYFAAGAVAVMVFAFAAFAATLNVDGGVLQLGADRDLTCTDQADVRFTGYETDSSTSQPGFINVQVSGLDDCGGQELFVEVFDGDQDRIWSSRPATQSINSSTMTFSVDVGEYDSGYELRATDGNARKMLGAEDVSGTRVKIQSPAN